MLPDASEVGRFCSGGAKSNVLGIHPGPWINPFDLTISTFFSHIANRSWTLDHAVLELNNNYLLRGGVIMILAWLCVFERGKQGQLRKGYEFVLGCTVLGVFGTAIARAMAHFLPYRVRPFKSGLLHFPGTGWDTPLWGCFPSDHAVLFMAIAIGIFFASRRLGLIAIAWVLMAICLPRLYLGQHWPTDILMGLAMGTGSAFLVKVPAIREFFRLRAAQWHEKYPVSFITVLFVWTLCIATIFEDVRHLLGFAVNIVKRA